MIPKLAGVVLCVALTPVILGLGAQAEPLATQGIGTSSCARLVNDSTPAKASTIPST
jgi:hypothetical protein